MIRLSTILLVLGSSVRAFLPLTNHRHLGCGLAQPHCHQDMIIIRQMTAGEEDGTSNDNEDQRRRHLVQTTWNMVESSLGEVEATKLFYERLFEQYPSVKPLFANSDMDRQANHLAQTIRLAVDSLDDLTQVVPVLQALGARHATKYRTELPHYDAVGQTLLWTLEQGLGPDVWTAEVAEAWTWVYTVIAETMGQAGQDAVEKSSQQQQQEAVNS